MQGLIYKGSDDSLILLTTVISGRPRGAEVLARRSARPRPPVMATPPASPTAYKPDLHGTASSRLPCSY